MRSARAGASFAALLLLVAHALAAEPEAQPTATEEKPRFFFDVGWDDAPTYEFGQRFPALEPYAWADAAKEVRVAGRIGASLYLDGGMLAGGALPDGPRFDVRRARLNTRGALKLLVVTEYKVEVGFEDRDFYLNDFFLRWRPERFGVDTVRFGYFDPPISLEALSGSADRSLMELPAPVAAFAPGYRLGVEATGMRARPSLNWSLNLSSVGQSQPNTDASSSSVLRAVGRLVWRPLGDERARQDVLLHTGVSVSQVISGSGDLQYRARPESFLPPYLVDTGNFDGNATLLGVEAAWRRGPLSLESEYLHAFVDADDAHEILHFEGAYLQLAWTVTGEMRPYDTASGVFTRLEPRESYKPFEGHWGALELAARASWLDLSDRPIRGGRMATFTFGPVWTWNRFVRLLAGYVYADVSDSPERSTAHVAQARIELRM
ncbi:MAG TPA: porin [Myxococcota bacterium]|nr:porin [Myxococcota bacterium]